ncbi:hypothetical protein WJX84_012438 [Apatococcus fuscideae]|uniref:pullulanase n=1 Tax=Apatococcus fuscideae TaxID=2026836 RepID=A0AAW1RRU8_9CHLO
MLRGQHALVAGGALIQAASVTKLYRLHSTNQTLALPTRANFASFRQFRSLAIRAGTAEPKQASQAAGVGSFKTVRVHYLNPSASVEGWHLRIWGPSCPQETEDKGPLQPTGQDDDGCYWDVQLIPDHNKVVLNHWLGLEVEKGGEPSAGGGMTEIMNNTSQLWMVAGKNEVAATRPTVAAWAGTLSESAAHWVASDLIAWRAPNAFQDSQSVQYALHWSASASLSITGSGLEGADGKLTLEPAGKKLPKQLRQKFPFLDGCMLFKLPSEAQSQVGDLVQMQLAIFAQKSPGQPLAATGIQMQGVLDEGFYYDGPLGASEGGGGTHFGLWAPTAQSVELLFFDGPEGAPAESQPMSKGPAGSWTFQAPTSWLWQYYKYRIRVYCPWTQKIELVEATDPYAKCCAADGRLSQVVTMDAEEMQPAGWSEHHHPPRMTPTDISIYELHIRDFSCWDESVPAELRGKYLAFAEQASQGVRHLKELQAAGLTHVHLLPAYDYGSVPERHEDQKRVEVKLSQYPADSEEQQAAVLAIADQDAFNWGYDPVHFSAPEGSYATDPDGPARVREFRAMVKALHGLGLRVVLDVVYNHTFAAGPSSIHSVLDKVVPGYYHRRTESGEICNSTCCNNTATEHAMCERLVIDDIVHWAKQYKIDGYRFDIMGHLMVSTMKKIQDALAALTPEKDGVDGAGLYIYGEAWDFGEVACNQRGRNACQLNIGGMGLGSFNDRMRDSIMGGSPFATPKYQGLITGLSTQPNWFTQGEMNASAQAGLAAEYADLTRLSMAGNLKEYELETASGKRIKGQELLYGNLPAGYTEQPSEHVAYTSCHDGEILFDQVMMKSADDVSLEERCLTHSLAQACVLFSQGIAFLHAGDELLRSKSLDRDGYNSGDWFNRLDYSGQTNNFGVGLPVATKNRESWPLKQPLLANPSLKPSPELIAACKQRFLVLLRMRYSSPLFRLPSSAAIQNQLSFLNTGPKQVPGVIVMRLQSSDAVNSSTDGIHDPNLREIFVVINSRSTEFQLRLPSGCGNLQLHPLQAASQSSDRSLRGCNITADNAVISARTAAVFVEPR